MSTPSEAPNPLPDTVIAWVGVPVVADTWIEGAAAAVTGVAVLASACGAETTASPPATAIAMATRQRVMRRRPSPRRATPGAVNLIVRIVPLLYCAALAPLARRRRR